MMDSHKLLGPGNAQPVHAVAAPVSIASKSTIYAMNLYHQIGNGVK